MDLSDKRTFLAITLALIVIVVSQLLLPQPETPPPSAPQKTGTAGEPASPVAPAPAPAAPAASAQAREMRVETEYYTAVFSSAGGTIREFRLKKYQANGGGGVTLLKESGVFPPLALGVSTEDFTLGSAPYTVRGTDLALKGDQTGTLVFEYSAPPVSVRRTYTFHGNRYQIDLLDEVAGLPEYVITLGSDFGIYDRSDTSAPHIGPVILKDTDRIELNPNDLKEPKVYTNLLHWIAQEDKYFFASIIPEPKAPGIIEARGWKLRDAAAIGFRAKAGANRFTVFAGPKEYNRLQELNVGLEHVIDFGFFSILARPLFWIMKFFYSFLGNYGWAIVLLTVIVRVPFIPLINKGQASMQKMKDLQPKLAEVKEKYKKDPQRLQKETMELYKKYKVNPMGGCLPLLLQIPVFFALYKVLLIAIELRGAPFISWLTDLSAPDTLFGHIPEWFPLIGSFAVGPLPIAMGVTTVIQQKMTPTSLDPAQNRIMMLMPVVFTFIFFNLASGLVLYWLVNNILSIAQQYYTNRRINKQSS